MGVVGIIAEYNPLHHGHVFQLREAVRLARAGAAGEDGAVVVVLSGDFVQRGEAAVFDKFARAEAAVRCGTSLVLELPVPWSLASAEGFARGGIGLLRAAGVVDSVCFGSESGSLDALRRCADALLRPDFDDALRRELLSGISFAAARERAAVSLAGEDAAGVLRSPNDLLGVEYLLAMERQGFAPAVHVVPRRASAHDGAGSALEVRRRIENGEEWLSLLPAESAAVFSRETERGRGPVTAGGLRAAVLSRLRERTLEDLSRLPDASEGLERRLYEAIQTQTDPHSIAMAAKSRRYALSRLRRMVMCAALGITADMAEGTPPYLRVLAMDDRGAALLREMKAKALLPVVTKAAHIRREDPRAAEFFALGSAAHDLYVLGRPSQEEQACGEDWRTTPFILQEK